MRKLLLSLLFFTFGFISLTQSVYSQDLNIASEFEINSEESVSGDIVIVAKDRGIILTDVSYDQRIFGVVQDNPKIVAREASASANSRPVVRTGETLVNVTDFNGEIKKGDYITTSPALGKGMVAGQSGYVVGVAIEDPVFTNENITVQGKEVRTGSVNVAVKIEYAELTTARNSLRLLDALNAALFRNIQDPEQFTNIIRFFIAGLIAILAFIIGFFSITRSISKSIEAIGRNPLARRTILLSMGIQIIITVIGALAAVAITFIIIRF